MRWLLWLVFYILQKNENCAGIHFFVCKIYRTTVKEKGAPAKPVAKTCMFSKSKLGMFFLRPGIDVLVKKFYSRAK